MSLLQVGRVDADEKEVRTTSPMQVMEIPQSTIVTGINTEGRNFFNKIWVKGSKVEYETKKMVKVFRYSWFVMWRSSWRPSILALPRS
jgi:hypothetical protein